MRAQRIAIQRIVVAMAGAPVVGRRKRHPDREGSIEPGCRQLAQRRNEGRNAAEGQTVRTAWRGQCRPHRQA